MNNGGWHFRFAWMAVAGLIGTPLIAGEVVTVTVQGEGISPDGAKNDALRKALEQGGGVEISSHSQVENFELIRDTIYARAEGIVKDYKILNQGEAMGGTYYCKIEAKVDKDAVATTWGEVQNVLDQVGRPGVAISIREFIDDVEDDSSILESKLKERLNKAGFDVYSSEQLKAIAAKESLDAQTEDNVAKMQAIAKDFDTQIFITGTAHANAAGIERPHGVTLAMYNGDIEVDMYYTDTAKLITSESEPVWRGGAPGHHTLSKQAGKMALSNAGQQIVNKLYESCMKYWATQISAGGEVQLVVEGIDMKVALQIKKKLTEIQIVSKVDGPKLTKGIATFKITADGTAETLVEYLVDEEWGSMIEVIDLKLNRIQAVKAGP